MTCEDLQCRAEDRWRPVPDWVRGLAQFGRSLRTIALDPSEKAVIALALPIHDWGAAFLTLGYLLGAQHTADADVSAERHFRRLMDLPYGTPVKLLHNGLQFDAVVDEKKKDPPVPQAGSQIVSVGFGCITSTIARINARGVKY
jgi:hypothetical protein